MDADSREISRQEYAPGELPPEYTANNSTAYIVLETRSASGSTFALYSAENTDIVTYAELKEIGVLTEKHTYVTFASNEADNALSNSPLIAAKAFANHSPIAWKKDLFST